MRPITSSPASPPGRAAARPRPVFSPREGSCYRNPNDECSALREEPGDYMSRYFLANCYEFLNRPQEAIEEYRTTLIVMSNSMEDATRRCPIENWHDLGNFSTFGIIQSVQS